ncbi:ATP synthase subunit I [Roseovarius arcticus]|uniref:ATP synthase subunit I n=1 Tax=Roseovarius arcticus TaxID=2547404 RepID=UPI0014872DF4|nr:ATP synthase subunit I [Roseovarius arcticus]
MITVDWNAVMLGVAAGLVMGACFFAGLAIGVRHALRSASPVKLLSISAALRISALLGGGWIIAGQGGPWAALGYGAAFIFARVVATTFARIGVTAGGAS